MHKVFIELALACVRNRMKLFWAKIWKTNSKLIEITSRDCTKLERLPFSVTYPLVD
jgi:hypothetical protein